MLLDVLAIRYGMIGSLGKLTCKDNSTDYAARVHEYCQSTSRALTFLKLKIVKLEWNRLLLDEEIQNILQSCEKLFRRYRRVCRVFDLNEIHGSNVVDAYRSMLVALQRTDLTQARHVSDVVGQQVGYVKTPSLARYGIELSEVDEMIRFSGYVSLPKEFYDQQSESE